MKRILVMGAAALLALASIACIGASADADDAGATPGTGGGIGAPAPLPDVGIETKVVRAPVLEAEIVGGEAAAPHALRLRAEIGDGCNAFAGIDVARDGDTIEVTVMRTVPAHPEVVLCAMLYQTHDETVSLGAGFVPGREYTVSVNGGERTLRFVAR